MKPGNYISVSVGKDLPKITVVTPSFNQKPFLGECIESILSQAYPNLEYIIMDGGSTDGSVELIRKHEKYLAYWQSRVDDGQYAAINEGFTRSTGSIMTWLNSDDRMHNHALHIVASIFRQRPDVQWLMGRPNGFDENATRLWVFEYLPRWSREKYLNKQYKNPYIQQEGTFWRRELWNKAGGNLRCDLRLAGDLELWVRFFRYEQLYTVDALLAGFRNHPGQKTKSLLAEYNAEAEEILEAETRFFRRNGNGPLLPAPEPLFIRPA
jgi:glycosyltransferase involved in cell wall biosynthesis